MRRAKLTILMLIVLSYASIAGATNYDEGVSGDLSNNGLTPTVIGPLTNGLNTITATSVSGDREYWTVTVPAGSAIKLLTLRTYTSTDPLSFIGVQAGTTFTEPPTGTNVANLLGYTHFGTGNSTVGANILDDIGLGAGAIGFTPPLAAGSYTFWTQQTGVNAATYVLDIQVASVVPASSSISLLLLCVGLAFATLMVLRRRDRRMTA